MAEEISNFEDTVKLIKFALTIFGIDISTKTRSRLSKFFFRHLLFFLEVFFIESLMVLQVIAIIEGIKNGESIIDVAVTTPCLIGENMISFKAICIYRNKNVLKDILNVFKSMHPEFDSSADLQIEKGLVSQSQQFLKFIVRLLLSSSVGLFLLILCLPTTVMIIDYIRSGVLNIHIPVQPKSYDDTCAMFLFFFYQVIASLFVCVNIFTNEATYYVLCTFLTMHFKLLCCKFRSLKYSENDNYQKLISLIVKHQKLIDISDDMENMYCKSNLSHIMLSSVMICFSGFIIVFNNKMELIAMYVIFLISIFTQVFFLCYFGDMIISSSTEVGDAVYESIWYNADKRTKQLLIIVLTRSQNPCKLTTAGFGDVNIVTFSSILSRSWSYFALLQTMFD